jgi:metal-responsive CopG/Arc/MetJ family transcriptional regulator
MANDKKHILKLPIHEELLNEFKENTRKEGTNMSEELRRYIRNYNREKRLTKPSKYGY